MRRLFLRLLYCLLGLIILLAALVGYVELACKGQRAGVPYQVILTPQHHRAESRSLGAVLAGVMFTSSAAPTALVLFPKDGFLRDLPEEIAILSATSRSLTLVSLRSDFTQTLYQAGALLVLPAGLSGCATVANNRLGQ